MHKENFRKFRSIFMLFQLFNLIEIICIFFCFTQIYDGTSSKSPKIAEICSSTHPPTIVSEGNSLTIALDKTVENDFAFTFDLRAYYTVIDNGKLHAIKFNSER